MQIPYANVALAHDRKWRGALIGEAEIRSLMTSALLRLATLAFAMAFAAHVSSTQNEGNPGNSAGMQTTAESAR